MKISEFNTLIIAKYNLGNNKYGFLISYFLESFRSVRDMQNDVLAYLESLINGTGNINDWDSFSWEGRVCFRTDHVMIIDRSFFIAGNTSPCLRNADGELILNQEYQMLEDTEYIEKHYDQYIKLSIKDFYTICQLWTESLK